MAFYRSPPPPQMTPRSLARPLAHPLRLPPDWARERDRTDSDSDSDWPLSLSLSIVQWTGEKESEQDRPSRERERLRPRSLFLYLFFCPRGRAGGRAASSACCCPNCGASSSSLPKNGMRCPLPSPPLSSFPSPLLSYTCLTLKRHPSLPPPSLLPRPPLLCDFPRCGLSSSSSSHA